MGLTEDGYVLTYGKYTRTTLELSSSLATVNSFVAVEGDASLWDTRDNEDGTVTIIGYNGEKSGDIIVPNIISGKLVTAMEGNYFYWETEITSVTFNYGLQTIGDEVFANCNGLSCEINFPSTLTSIGARAFYYCTGITTDLDILAKQKVTMGKNAFYGCSKITGSIQTYINNVLGEEQDDGTYEFSITTIPEGICSGFSGLTGDLVIPSCVTVIETNAFYNCSGVESISFESSNTLTYIGEYAFYGCSGLVSDLSLPNTITFIGIYAFYNCSGLTSINIPTSLTTLGSYAFWNCKNAQSAITIPSAVNYYTENNSTTKLGIGEYTFYCCAKLTTITFMTPASSQTIEIGSYAFSGCSNVETITLPSTGNVKLSGYSFSSVGTNATALYLNYSGNISELSTHSFYNCTKLQSYTYNSGIVSIPSYCFYNCAAMTTMPPKGQVTTINDYAFCGCKSLGLDSTNYSDYLTTSDGTTYFKIITWLGNSVVTSLGQYAFANCTQMIGNIDTSSSITNVNSSAISINGLAFYGCTSITSHKTLNLATVTTTNADGSITTTTKTSIDDSEFEGNTILYDTEGNEITEIVIPANITSIGSRAFYGCTGITKVIFHDNITSIGSYAFYRCTNLEFIGCNSILKNGTELATGETSSSYDTTATYTLGSLTGYGFPCNQDFTTISQDCFCYCTSLKNICYSGEASGTAATSIAKVKGTSTNPTVVYIPTVTYEKGTEPTDEGGDGTLHIISATWTKYENDRTGYFFPSNVTEIQTWAFYGSGLSMTVYLNQIKTLGSKCLQNTSISGVVWGDNLEYVGWATFYETGISGEFVVPNTVTSFGTAFGNNNVTSVYIPATVTSFVGNGNQGYFMTSLYNLKSITVDSTALTSLLAPSFQNCSSLVHLDIPFENIVTIASSCFTGLTSLEGEAYFSSCSSIGSSSFKNCPNWTAKFNKSVISSSSIDLETCFQNCGISFGT